jgi:predicted nuclease of restriction endonuclease-like RecB superfamily
VIRPLGDSQFQFILGGPSSALRATRRYGVAMAKMIPMLLSCKDWRLSAIIDTRSGRPMQMQLSSEEGLTSPVLPPEEFDSEVEAELMAKWQVDPVSGWTMHREAEPLVKNQKVYLPDFLLEHQSGKKLHIEVLGFWTPEYIDAKLKTLELFEDEPILLIAAESNAQKLQELPLQVSKNIIWYKTRIPFGQLVDRLNEIVKP